MISFLRLVFEFRNGLEEEEEGYWKDTGGEKLWIKRNNVDSFETSGSVWQNRWLTG